MTAAVTETDAFCQWSATLLAESFRACGHPLVELAGKEEAEMVKQSVQRHIAGSGSVLFVRHPIGPTKA
jgi:hypothetical protein